MREPWGEVAALLPDKLKKMLPQEGGWTGRVEELRLRAGRPMQLKATGWEYLSARPVDLAFEMGKFARCSSFRGSMCAWPEPLKAPRTKFCPTSAGKAGF